MDEIALGPFDLRLSMKKTPGVFAILTAKSSPHWRRILDRPMRVRVLDEIITDWFRSL